MSYEIYQKHLNSRNYDYAISEMPTEGPVTRFIDGITLLFDNLDKQDLNLQLFFSSKAAFEAINIFEYITWIHYLKWNEFKINDNVLPLPQPLTEIKIDEDTTEFVSTLGREKAFNEMIKMALSYIKNDNCIKISLKDESSFNFLLHCAIYKVYSDLPEDYYLSKELEIWSKMK